MSALDLAVSGLIAEGLVPWAILAKGRLSAPARRNNRRAGTTAGVAAIPAPATPAAIAPTPLAAVVDNRLGRRRDPVTGQFLPERERSA